MRPFEFYQHHLDAVSRSFALCIPQLSPPFRDQVALSYLLLRILDTVEDAPFPDRSEQARQFAALRGFLREPATRPQVESFIAAFPAAGVSEAERALLVDTQAFLEDAYEQGPQVRAAILDAIDRMGQGMAAYALRPPPLRLIDLQDVVRYCCIVAGLVGELLTRLWALNGRPAPRMVDAYRFGLFLQKVNILKDQAEDEKAGRFLVPDRRELLASLREDSRGAISYLTSLPREERGYRIFCAWSLMLGASTLAEERAPGQTRRAQTLALLNETAEIVKDDAALRALFDSLMPELPDLQAPPALPKPPAETALLRRLLSVLDAAEMRSIGAIDQ